MEVEETSVVVEPTEVEEQREEEGVATDSMELDDCLDLNTEEEPTKIEEIKEIQKEIKFVKEPQFFSTLETSVESIVLHDMSDFMEVEETHSATQEENVDLFSEAIKPELKIIECLKCHKKEENKTEKEIENHICDSCYPESLNVSY